MLGSMHELNYDEMLMRFPLNVVMPPQLQLELRLRGTMGSLQQDDRVSPRFRCRGTAILEWLESPVALSTKMPTTSQAIVRNVSRSGFAVLADCQWYPEQMLRVYLPVAIATVRVARVRRMGSRCYDLGLRIVHYTQTQMEMGSDIEEIDDV